MKTHRWGIDITRATSVVFLIFCMIPVPICAEREHTITGLEATPVIGASANKQLDNHRDRVSLIHAYRQGLRSTRRFQDAPIQERTYASQAILTASDGAASDLFGESVAISGDTAIVGAEFHDVGTNNTQGAAYVFVRSGGSWSQQAVLTANDGAALDSFGVSVAISGNTAVVGARNDDVGTNVDQGSVYVFSRSGTTWTQQAKLTALDGAANDLLGVGVGISGLNVIVGAPGDDVGTTSDQGSAYIFVRSIATPIWSQQAKLTFIDGEENDGFGSNVAISGSTAIVSLPVDTVGGNFAQGSACVFVRSGTTWSQQARLLAADGAAGDNFGTGVAISGDTAIVGSLSDDAPAVDQGSAYVFVRSGTTWTQQTKLVAADGAGDDEFGCAVSISGENVIVGSRLHNVGPVTNAGAAYIFSRSGATWTQKKKLVAPDVSQDIFGRAVAISDGLAIVGAPFRNVGSNPAQGSAYIFVSTTPFDFDGDGKTDIGIFRPTSGEWWIQRSSTGVTMATPFGASTDKPVPADYTGDGETDIAVWRPSTGFWFVLRSEDNSFFSFPFGTNGDIPVPFSFDADVQAEPVVFRPSTGTWFVTQFLVSNQTIAIQWGGNGDIPVPGDFTNEGTSAIAIYRPSNGQWWIRRETPQGGNLVLSFGTGSDKPVPGDYTGDGIADAAFFRPSTAEWFILRSQDFSFFSFPFGTNGDIPAPGDYDGDGKFDVTVFRPSTGSWFISRSTGGLTIDQFGIDGDRPIANAFVP